MNWVDANKRKPPKGRQVLVLHDDQIYMDTLSPREFLWVMYWNGDEWVSPSTGQVSWRSIDYWHPLPKLPAAPWRTG